MDVYHCTPSELDKQDYQTVQTHIELLAVKAEVDSMSALKR